MSESTAAPVEQSNGLQSQWPALTIEAGLYGALALLALGMRLLFLDRAPLTASESSQALAAWNWVNGGQVGPFSSPLLFTANVVLYGLFGASDAATRILPALFGSVLVLVPALLRREMGRAGALISAILLVFSPSLVFFSRQADGAVIAVTCGAAACGFGWRYWTERKGRDLNWAAIAVAVGLVSAREIWMIGLAVALFVGWQWLTVRRHSLQSAPEKYDQTNATAFVPDREHWKRAIILFAAVFVGVSTTFLLHREGLGSSFDLFGAWLEGLRPSVALYDPLRLIVIYEPLALLLGTAAMIDWALADPADRRVPLFRLLLVWSVVAFVLYSFGADKNPARVVVIIVPLLFGAGWYLGEWLTEFIEEVRSRPPALATLLSQEAPAYLFSCALVVFLGIVMAEFAMRGSVLGTDWMLEALRANQAAGTGFYVVVLGLLVLAVVAAIAALTISTVGTHRAKAVGMAIGITVLVVWTGRQMSMANYTVKASVADLLAASATPDSIRDLVADLKGISRWRANDSQTMAILADESLGPVVQWYLREFRNARFVSRPTVTPGTEALLLPTDTPVKPTGLMSQQYGILMVRGNTSQLNLARWLFFRDNGTPEYKDVSLWIPQPR